MQPCCLRLISDFKNNFFSFINESSYATLLNIAVSIPVIVFIVYQMMSLIPKPIKTNNKDVKQFSYVKNRIDRGCNDESYFVDLHEHVFIEKEVHYSVPFMHETEMLRSSQYFYERMKLRRSVRHFSSKSVPMKIVQNIIKIAGCSPSVGNTQPWKFCVVMDEKRKAEIRAIVEADARANYVRRTGDGSEWVMGVSQMQETWRRPYLTDAPLLLVVCHEIFKIVGDKHHRLLQYNQISTAIAVGMLLSAIQYVGLSTVVTSPLNVGSNISRILRRPSNECVFLLLPLGYAAADALVPDLKRKSIEHIIKLY